MSDHRGARRTGGEAEGEPTSAFCLVSPSPCLPLRLPGTSMVRNPLVPVLGDQPGLVSVSLFRPHECSHFRASLARGQPPEPSRPRARWPGLPAAAEIPRASRPVLLAVQLVDSCAGRRPHRPQARRGWRHENDAQTARSRTRRCSSSPKAAAPMTAELSTFRPGFCLLARRSGATIVPVAIQGAFASMPRGSIFPRPGSITLAFASPITSAHYEPLGDAQLVQLVESRIARSFA